MLTDLVREMGRLGLELHFGKTKVLHNGHGAAGVRYVEVNGVQVEVMYPWDATMHLGRSMCLRTFHDTELEH